MAEYIEITDAGGTKRKVAADEIASIFHERSKLQVGGPGEANDVSNEHPVPVSDAGGSLTVDSSALGTTTDAEAEGNGSIIALLKRLRKLLEGSGSVKAVGDVASGSSDSGSPVKTGGVARTELPAAVSAGQRVNNSGDKFGRQLVAVAPLDARASGTLNRTTNEAGQLLAALSEGAYVVTAITATNAHASVGTKVEILDGETVKWKGYAGALGGGFSIADTNGLFAGSKNTALKAKCVTTGADVDISVSAYKIPA